MGISLDFVLANHRATLWEEYNFIVLQYYKMHIKANEIHYSYHEVTMNTLTITTHIIIMSKPFTHAIQSVTLGS